MTDATAELILRHPWDLMVTLTTRETTGPETLAKRYRELVRRVENEDPGLGLGSRDLWRAQERLRHVVAWELQARQVWHLHALWGAPGARGIRREWVAKEWNRLCRPRSPILEEHAHGIAWLVTRDRPAKGRRLFELAGTADLSLIRDPQAVAAYCAKYVAKGGAVDLYGIDGSAAGQSAGP